MNKLLITLPLIVISGCYGPERMVAYNSSGNQLGAIDGSIFPSDTQMASNDDVVRVLEGKVPMKEKGGLAILSIGQMYFIDAGYSDALQKVIRTDLAENKFIGDITGVPRMLMPTKITVSNIREMGARLQCENVLVYTAFNDTRYEKNTFSKDEMHVNLTVEGALVNVRTGCIPVALSVDKDIVMKETEKDKDRYEFYRRGQRECLTSGIQEICSRINLVMSQVQK